MGKLDYPLFPRVPDEDAPTEVTKFMPVDIFLDVYPAKYLKLQEDIRTCGVLLDTSDRLTGPAIIARAVKLLRVALEAEICGEELVFRNPWNKKKRVIDPKTGLPVL